MLSLINMLVSGVRLMTTLLSCYFSFLQIPVVKVVDLCCPHNYDKTTTKQKHAIDYQIKRRHFTFCLNMRSKLFIMDWNCVH